MLLGQRLGVRADVLADVIGSATGACWSCNTNNPVPGALPGKSPPSEREFDGGFATTLMLKVRLSKSPSAAEMSFSVMPFVPASERQSMSCFCREMFIFKPVWSSAIGGSIASKRTSSDKRNISGQPETHVEYHFHL